MSKPRVDFEEALRQVGDWDRYQYQITTLIVFAAALYSYTNYPAILYLYVPDSHWCALPEGLEVPTGLDHEGVVDLFVPKGDRKTWIIIMLQSFF